MNATDGVISDILNPQEKNPQRIKKIDKEYIKNLDYNGIELLVPIKQYNAIDKQNNISINVFGYQDKQPYPVYLSKTRFGNCMNPLFISGEKDVFQFGEPTAEDWVTKSVVNQMVDVNGRQSFFKRAQI